MSILEPGGGTAPEALPIETGTARTLEPKPKAIDAIGLETRVSTLRTRFLEPMRERFQSYLKLYRLDFLMPGINLEAALETAFSKVAKLYNEPLALDEETLTAQIIKKMVGFFCRELDGAMIRENYFVALQYLVMAHECARIGNTEIGTVARHIEYFVKIENACQNAGGHPEQLLIRARHLLPDKIARNYVRRNLPAADSGIFYDASYKDVAAAAIESLDETTLLKYSWSALEDDDFDKAIVFSHAALKSSPANSNAYVFLAAALGKKGFRLSRESASKEESETGVAYLQAALAVRLIIGNLDVIKTDEMQCRNNTGEIANVERKIDLKNPSYDHEDSHWPGSHHEFYRSRREDTASCPTGILIRYSKGARASKEFAKCLFFQEEIVKRQPHSIGVLFALLTIYEHMQMPAEALAIRKRIYELFPCDAENKLKLRVAGEIEQVEAQSQKRTEKLMRGGYVEEITAALARAKKSEAALNVPAAEALLRTEPISQPPARKAAESAQPTERYPRAPGWGRGTPSGSQAINLPLFAAPAAPPPEEPPTSIDRSTCYSFLTSLLAVARAWAIRGGNEKLRLVPAGEKENLQIDIVKLNESLRGLIPRELNNHFRGCVGNIIGSIKYGYIDINTLGTLIDIFPATLRGAALNQAAAE